MGVKVARKKTYIGKDADGEPVYKLSEALWIFIDHKGGRKAVKVGSKDVAKAAARKIEEKLTTGKLDLNPPETPDPVLFGKYAEKWMAGHVAANLKESTARGYRGGASTRTSSPPSSIAHSRRLRGRRSRNSASRRCGMGG